MLPRFACVGCGGVLTDSLSCAGCGRSYECVDGIYRMVRGDASWEQVQKEAVGTIECLKADGVYKPDTEEYVDLYPFFEERNEGSDANRVMFEMCLEAIGDRRGSLLEIGMKNGWAANQFVKRGFEVVATDITDDPYMGLGYSKRLIAHTGRPYVSVLCDAAYLPFDSGQFDIVFMCSTLHHVRDMQRGLREVHRVLKDGGVFVDMGDPPRHPQKSEQESLAPAWREKYLYNVDEKQPSIPEYYSLFESAGFSKYRMLPFDDTFLRNGFKFGTDKMLAKIRSGMESKAPHSSLSTLCDQLSWKTKSMWTREDVFFLNWFLWVPNNCIWWAVK